MNIQHNKKRNVGIIYELLLRSISASLVEGNKIKAQDALDIIAKYYDKSTELYKEYRLFNALVKSTVSDTPVAAAVLAEAKFAARRFDLKKLDHEKSLLIRDINHGLQDSNFYHRRIPDYRYYATIQNLMNEWSTGDRSDLVKTVTLEGQVVQWLLKEKKEADLDDVKPNIEVDGLVVKIMSEKFNQKYGNKLNDSQTQLIRDYIFSIENQRETDFLNKLEKLREQALNKVSILKLKTENQILQERIPLIERALGTIRMDQLDDETISKFMTVSQLVTELSEEDSENV